MSEQRIHVDNESSVQDPLLTAADSIALTNVNHSSTESRPSETKILSGATLPQGGFKSKPPKDYWGWELFGIFVSAATLIGIAIILDMFDGKRQPSWKHISLNTLVSWLSTFAKVSVLMPITSGLGQLKWVWFAGGKRPLSDLEVFDSATRDISGSAKLLWRLKGLNFAGIGSLSVILAFGFDSFIQNLIHYYPNDISEPSQPSYLANASIYNTTGPLNGGDFHYVDPVLKSNAYNSLFNPNSAQLWSQPQYICTTGNCTWQPVASIAMYPLCSDISTDLSMSCTPESEGYSNCTVSLSTGFATWFVNGGLNGIPMIIGNTQSDGALVYKNQSLPVIQAILALSNDTDFSVSLTNETQFIATECALAPCVRSVQATVSEANYSESTPKYWFDLVNSTDDSTSTSTFVTLNPPWGPELGVQEGQSFGIDLEAFNSLNSYILNLFSGNVRISSDDLHFDTGGVIGYGSSADMIQAIYFGDFTECDNPSDKVGCAVKNIAGAMSKSFWDSPYIRYGITGASMARGETITSVTFVRIVWWWLALPVAVWVLSVVTLLGTLWKTHTAQVQTWRNNLLPLVFLQLDEDHEAVGRRDISAAGFSKTAEKLCVQLYAAEGDVRLVD